MKMENPFFYFLIYELFENDHSITITELEGNCDIAPLFNQMPEGELFQHGTCKCCDDELMYSGVIIDHGILPMLKHVKQSSMPKAIFDKLF